ncbi:MAG: zinc ribbon domain-containing protein [Bacteroidetes bacterium]|nr:zinc ribbon domain-containing protein [Bacteroidota bacterium]
MICPKCATPIKEGAKFCHVCGFNIAEMPADPTPQQQPPQQQNFNPNYDQGVNYNQPPVVNGFDITKIPLKDWIYAGIAFLGLISTFLPWVNVSTAYMGFGGSVSANGLNSIFGILALMGFFAVAALTIFGQLIGLTEKLCNQITSFTSIGIAASCLIFFITIFTSGQQAILYIQVSTTPGFGLILALLASIALILIGFKVIKLK